MLVGLSLLGGFCDLIDRAPDRHKHGGPLDSAAKFGHGMAESQARQGNPVWTNPHQTMF
jgi:hypothetical protein